MIDFKAELKACGLKQIDFIRIVKQLSGRDLSATTTYRWGKDGTSASPVAIAFLKLLQRLPEEVVRDLASEAKETAMAG